MEKAKLLLLFLMFLFLIVGCTDDSNPTIVQKPDKEYWKSNGYGYIISCDNSTNTFSITNVTKSSSIFWIEGDIRGEDLVIPDWGDAVICQLQRTGNQGKVILEDGEFEILKIDTFPEKIITDETSTPVNNLTVLDETIRENFPFFSINPTMKTAWENKVNQYKRVINDKTCDFELYSCFCDLLQTLNDGHTSINAEIGDEEFDSTFGPVKFKDYIEWIDENRENDFAMLKHIAAQMDGGTLIPLLEDIFYSGQISTGNSTIAYLNIFEYSEDEFVEIYSDYIKSINNSADALIIDLRYNDGGNDVFANAIASSLTDKNLLLYSKKYRIDESDPTVFSNEQTFNTAFPDVSKFLNKPVTFLTTRYSNSAVDNQIMMMKDRAAFSNVRIVGDTTNGIHSNSMDKVLPNGWEISTSFELFSSHDGTVYEQIGIAPDLVVIPEENAFPDGILCVAISDILERID